MTLDLVRLVADTARPWQRPSGDAHDDPRLDTNRSAVAIGALLTVAKVGLACVAILVVLPIVLAAQAAIGR